jgi:hypothetical protein
MDSYKSLRIELENCASELTVEKFQALGPGMGLGVLQNTNQSASIPSVREFKASTLHARQQVFAAPLVEDRIVIRSDKSGAFNAPFWARILGHLADLLVAGLCLMVCMLGFKLMTNEISQIKHMKIEPFMMISGIYASFLVYGLTFKLIGLPMLGSHIRYRFSRQSMRSVSV